VIEQIKFKILEIMAQRGFRTRKALAEKAGLPAWRVGAYAKGEVSLISVETLKSLCRALQCQPGDLLSYEGPGAAPEESPSLESLVRTSKRDGFVEYDVSEGTGFGNGLFAADEVAVQRAFFSAGTVLAEHSHSETEVLVSYRGRFRLVMGDGSEREYVPGEVALILPGMAHSVVALDDWWVIGITVPGSSGYPGVR